MALDRSNNKNLEQVTMNGLTNAQDTRQVGLVDRPSTDANYDILYSPKYTIGSKQIKKQKLN